MKILYDRVKCLCHEHGVSISKMESDLHFSNSSVKKWKGNCSPSVDKAIAISNYFNVSVDYLVGKTDIRYTTADVVSDTDLSIIFRAMQRMSAEDIHRMRAILEIVFYYVFSEL